MAHENPFVAPESFQPSGDALEPEPLVYCNELTRRRILTVAVWQRYTWMLLLLSLVIILCFVFFSEQPGNSKFGHSDRGYFHAALLLGTLSFVLHGFYKLAESLELRFPLLLTMLLLTGIGLLLIPYLSYRATLFLRSFGFDVGSFGTSSARLDKLIGVTSDS
jgi:hypothetical protein